jgi:hypothetical protein
MKNMKNSVWNKIEFAPKDGREIVVIDIADQYTAPQFAKWVGSNLYVEGGYWSNRDGKHREMPTHFFELPPV